MVLFILAGTVQLVPFNIKLTANSVALLPANSIHGFRNIGTDVSVHFAIELHTS